MGLPLMMAPGSWRHTQVRGERDRGLARGAALFEALAADRHVEPGSLGAQTAFADIIERREIGIGAGAGGLLAVAGLGHGRILAWRRGAGSRPGGDSPARR